MYSFNVFNQWRDGRAVSDIFNQLLSQSPECWQSICETSAGILRVFFTRLEIRPPEGEPGPVGVINYRGLYRIVDDIPHPIQLAETYTEVAVGMEEGEAPPVCMRFEYYDNGQVVRRYTLSPTEECFELRASTGEVERVTHATSADISSFSIGTLDDSGTSYIEALHDFVKTDRAMTLYCLDKEELNPSGTSFSMSVQTNTGQCVDIRIEKGMFCRVKEGYFLFSGEQSDYGYIPPQYSVPQRADAAKYFHSVLRVGTRLSFKREMTQYQRIYGGQICDGTVRRRSYEISSDSTYKMGELIGTTITMNHQSNEFRFHQHELIHGISCAFIYVPGREIQGVFGQDAAADFFRFIEHIHGSELYQHFFQVVAMDDFTRVCEASLRDASIKPSRVPELLFSASTKISSRPFLDIRQCAASSLLSVLQQVYQDFQAKRVTGQVADGVAWLKVFFERRAKRWPILKKTLSDRVFKQTFPTVLLDVQANELSEAEVDALLAGLVSDASLILRRIFMMYTLRERVNSTPVGSAILRFLQQEITRQFSAVMRAEEKDRAQLMQEQVQQVDIARLSFERARQQHIDLTFFAKKNAVLIQETQHRDELSKAEWTERQGLFFSMEASHRKRLEGSGLSIRRLAPALPSMIVIDDDDDRSLVLALYRMHLMSYFMKKGESFDEVSLNVFHRKGPVERTLSRSGVDLKALELDKLRPAVAIAAAAWLFHLRGGRLSLEVMQTELRDCVAITEWRMLKKFDSALLSHVFCSKVVALYRDCGLSAPDVPPPSSDALLTQALQDILHEGAKVYIQTLEPPIAASVPRLA